jgi:hypothetical protein
MGFRRESQLLFAVLVLNSDLNPSSVAGDQVCQGQKAVVNRVR